MITVKIQGGLGNQLFQYAFGRQLALAHNVELLLDTTIYEDYPFHEYGLGMFVIAEQFATKEAVAAFKKVKPRKGRRNIVYNALFADPHEYIVERKFSYDASIQKEGPNAYFDGYWQTEKYFAGIEEIIRKDFTLKVPLSEHGKYAAEIIRNTTAISLHVRRGLYVSHPVFSAIHGACTPEYFKNAIDYISSRVENPHFFIFSDDQAWARENIKPNFQTFDYKSN